MAKAETKTEDNPKSDESKAPAAAPPQAVQSPEIDFDASRIPSLYCNFARVTGSPEEMIIDFGLNPQPFGGQNQAVPISQRLVMNYYTAKRFLGALHMAVQRHEQTFGVLETDINKRVLPQATRQSNN